MPHVEQLFGGLGDVTRFDGRKLSAKDLVDVDILLVRSVTQVNESLLKFAKKLKFVGSATIGKEHLDLDYLSCHKISYSTAPGCNATAVGEYVFIALLELAVKYGEPLTSKTVGIVGAGNTGTALAKCLQAYGVKVLLCDPLLQQTNDEREFHSFDSLLKQSDVISLHVPLTLDGLYPTLHLLNQDSLQKLTPNCWLINACRGAVIDNQALIEIKQQRPEIKLVLDVWEGEPTPVQELVSLAEIATPHIAGYSVEGKTRGTLMLYQTLMSSLVKQQKQLNQLTANYYFSEVKLSHELDDYSLLKLCRLVYDLRDDDRQFRKIIKEIDGFDTMRKNHRHRRELSALTLVNEGDFELDWLTKLGFSGVNL